MPVYAYKGIGPSGKQVSGMADAESPKSLRQTLKRDGVVVTSYDISKGGKAAKVQGSGLSREVKFGDVMSRVKKEDVAAFTRQLATLLNAGIPLAQSLGALFEQIENPKLKPVVGEVRTAVNEGSSLGDHLDFLAEIDLLGALSACPGGDCSSEHSSDTAICHPLLVEVFDTDATATWVVPPVNGYDGSHGAR